MGFKARVYKLTWPEGHEFHELEIRLSGMTVKELKKVSAIESSEGKTSEEREEAIDSLVAIFAKHLLSWTYEDYEGNPVGTTVEDVANADLRIILPAAMRWSTEVSRVPDPSPSVLTDLPSPSPMN